MTRKSVVENPAIRKPTNVNRTNDTQVVAAHILANAAVAPYAKLVGLWVWVEFPAKPDADVIAFLKAEGFHWNRKRAAWQHPCGRFSRMGSTDPRWKYGEAPLSVADET